MALTKSAQTPHASASLTTGGGTINGSGGWLPINYGVSIVIKITNGATGPTAGASAYVEVAEDSSGTNAEEVFRATEGDLSANAVNRWPVNLGVGGAGGDYSHYRVSFPPPTGQNVTAAARGMTTTAII